MIKFIEYTGRYPNLCSGRLFVQVDNKIISFGNYCLGEFGTTNDVGIVNYPKFWITGGGFKENYESYQGNWKLIKDKKRFPANIRKLLPELIKLFNENVEHGCCGGCA